MKRKFSDLSVSKKTIILLLIFVLLPALFTGVIFLNLLNDRQIASEKKITAQKLETTSNSLYSYMKNIEEIAVELGHETSVNEIIEGEGSISRYTDANKKMDTILKYNDLIIKIQFLCDTDIIWQYGVQRFIFEDGGNSPFSSRVQSGEVYDLWSPGHIIYQLEKGKFDKKLWFSSYYNGIYDSDSFIPQGVIALHIEEDSICKLYKNGVEGVDSVCWLISQEGDVISSTDKSFYMSGLPEELRIDVKDKKKGNMEIQYKGKSVIVFWNQCGNTGNYLMQMREMSQLKSSWIYYLCLVVVIFLLFCIGFLAVYNKYVIHPLRKLSSVMENTSDLNHHQEIIPVYRDEIGNLTIAYGEMINRIEQLVQDVYVETIKTQEAEKEALLAQINPHFLYNTLDSIRWNAMMNGDREVGRQLEALSVMLRETLNFGNKYTTLGQEMTIIRNYCYLLQARFRTEIDIHIEILPEDEVWEVPKLLIQPLVENAYKHGLESKVGNKHIWVKVKRFHEKLVIYVADDGVGCDAVRIRKEIESEGENCFALRNVKERIRMEYGDCGKFLFYSHLGRGTLVKLILKLEV